MIDDEAAPHDLELRSFGRRRGRKLSARQERLLAELAPRVRPDLAHPAPADVATLFDTPVQQVWLEIGFGGAEHLVWQARHHPHVGIIGCEPFEEGVVKALTLIEDEKLPNILVHADDVRPLLRWLPAGSLDRAFVLFPDPWPKARHRKRRLVGTPLLDQLARAMKSGGELRLGTDIGDYARTMLAALMRHPQFRWTATCAADWRNRPADWPQTRYEAKALREGRRCTYLRFVRV
ncbi:MAG: tRNA (guanosine(46)-N7)-methyltransferase TrmB [Hyphomicrobium sp.]|nr:tRNA (guanosine(46)-N7)-methyltransferase TrmB [Hyphomicrobium sp.]MBN9277753.1 tRNA (guanosine(46)-N7)-methyltransferase TrmB [Hyphomicrobium sp.]